MSGETYIRSSQEYFGHYSYLAMKIVGNIDFNSIIQGLKFKAKFSSTPQGRWFSQSGRHLSLVASLLGATGLILAVKDGKVGNFMKFGLPWSSDGHVTSERVVSGLQNLGNNCFLNVILQALASCSSLRRFLEEIIEEYEFGTVEECAKILPLTVAVASLLEELCVVQDGRSVRNPRNVMIAMDHYVPKFNLTSQQDAEEAYFHLLSSLREELSECYVSNDCSLADVTAPHNFRIISSNMRPKESEQKRWQRSFLGPFDGIVGSILTCQSCSFQISLDFQLFHSLHLSPVLCCDGAINAGCSLEDCLSHFFVSEQLENYFCNHCWHVAAIKYLTIIKHQADIKKLKQCNEEDSCDCKNLCSLRSLPWSNSFSKSFKQLNMARSPQILCIHLQRASVNLYGEPVKLLVCQVVLILCLSRPTFIVGPASTGSFLFFVERFPLIFGHISFPLILDLSPFIKRGIKNLEENSQMEQPQTEYQATLPCTGHQSTQLDAGFENFNEQTGRRIFSSTEIPDRQEIVASPKTVNATKAWPNTCENGGFADFMHLVARHSNYKGGGPSTSRASRDHHMYRLVSVVQHFGKVGTGHYTVYRRVKAETGDEDPIVLLEPTHAQWFCISDSEVHSVSEKDVLEIEASLLFYEKID